MLGDISLEELAVSPENHLVVKSNALVQASYKLTLNEQRLVLLGVSILDSRRPGIRPGFNQIEGIKITAEAFAEAFHIDMRYAYDELKEATNNLFERSVIQVNGKRTVKDRWVSRVEYHDGEGWAELSFSHHLMPHLTSLGRDFTKYRLGQVANLRSTYAVRIFEWCIQYIDNGWMVVTLDELRQRLGVSYTKFYDLRRFVIEPAVKELQAKSNLDISWQPVKEGRAVKAVKFVFKEQSQRNLNL
jgi:plasmid replication initiation protein